MSDVRALLKAKRQEARVVHPLATYTTNGVLRCTACSSTIKQASAWDGHVGSKGHRVNVIKMKEQQQKQKELEQLGTPKRKASDVDSDDEMSGEEVVKKRKIDGEEPQAAPPTSGFPANFFSDPSRAPAVIGDDSDDEEAEVSTVPPPAASTNPIDLEWERFQQTMLGGAPAPDALRKNAYDRATVAVEAELNDTMEGLPSQLEAVDVGATSEEPLNDDQLRKIKEQEEKELIMDRMFEEERAQEEADAKVTVLKLRLDALKKKRQAAKAAKNTAKV